MKKIAYTAWVTTAMLTVSLFGAPCASARELDHSSAVEAAGKASYAFGYAWDGNYHMENEVRSWPCGENTLVMTIPFDSPDQLYLLDPNGKLLMFRSFFVSKRCPVNREDAMLLAESAIEMLWPDESLNRLNYTDTGDGCVISALVGNESYQFTMSNTSTGALILEACEPENPPLYETMPYSAVRLFANELTNRFLVSWDTVQVDLAMTDDDCWLTSGRIRKNEISDEAAAVLSRTFGDTENGWILQQRMSIHEDVLQPVELKRLLTRAETVDTDYAFTGQGYPDTGEWFEEQIVITDRNGAQQGMLLTLLNKLDMPDMAGDTDLSEPLPDSIPFVDAVGVAYRALEEQGLAACDWETSCIIFGYCLWNHVNESPAWQFYLHTPYGEQYELYIDAQTGELLDCMLPNESHG